MPLARKHTEMSFPEIGRFMGNKNHSTVILANRKIDKLLKEDATVGRQTPAGVREERLRDIVHQIEEQLGRYARGSCLQSKIRDVHVPTPQPAAFQSNIELPNPSYAVKR